MLREQRLIDGMWLIVLAGDCLRGWRRRHWPTCRGIDEFPQVIVLFNMASLVESLNVYCVSRIVNNFANIIFGRGPENISLIKQGITNSQ